MKALLVFAILATFAVMIVKYRKSRDAKSLLIAFGSFVFILALAMIGNVTRSIIPLFLAHMVLIIFAWTGVLIYLFKNRYYWWMIVSPLLTIGLFLLLELMEGSAHEELLMHQG
ncbi:MAG: hypothetical protein IE885_05250 [Campylobacterales bacterium]|nr:hypothetical protein [Campylobacterales bacterium]